MYLAFNLELVGDGAIGGAADFESEGCKFEACSPNQKVKNWTKRRESNPHFQYPVTINSLEDCLDYVWIWLPEQDSNPRPID